MRSLSPAMKRRDAFRRTDKPDLFPNGEQVPKVKRSPPSNVSSPILSSEDDKSPSDETRTVNETKKMFESPNQENLAPKAPSKPPRTFAHDIYVKQKAAIKKPPIPDFESHLSPNSSLRSGELRRRSRSLEHIYAEPLPVTATSNRKQRASLEVEPYCVTPLFSTPVSTPSKPCTVREIIKNSFGVLRKLTRQKSSDDIDTRTESSDSGSEASLKDLKERLIYVQTIKKSFSRSATHYYSTDQMKSPALCRCCLILDDDDEKRQTVPYNVEVVNFEAVSHLITSGREIDTKFYWFTMYTKGDLFLYAYCFRQKNEKRTICLLSDVFFPELFHRIFNTFFTQTEIKVELIDYLRSKSCALPGEMLTFNNQTVLIPFDCQITITTPSILLNFFSAETLIKAVSTLVHERRVILVSKSIQTLFISSQSLISLIYPFAWDYVYMPLIPSEMLEFYASLNGIPYVIGLKSSDLHPFLRKARRRESKILVIDLDNGSVVTEVGDESEIIPYKIQRAVINALNLSRNMTDPKENYRDLVVREAFIQMFIELIGTARCYIANGEFKTQYFINSIRSKNIQMFAHWFCETRLFEAFIKYCHLRHIQSQIQPLFNKQRRMGTFERETQMACKAICVDLFKVKTDEKGTEKKIWPLRNINIFQTHS
ncbi:hypothetical protein B4U79_07433 [Dinothrombium tinctorium]|uniref:UDENN domain-containing protein n=1 Tax=Dinothrombium tinctorium TaxID=1965070 RepID=A0A443RAV1_9ACAR|nr:hypothetical protein B4U79_07433 [Dinothrombium tinctorium]